MIHIPIEILHLIFIKLDLKNRLECMLVCHYWHNVLDRRSLLHDLSIRNHHFSRFKDMIERLPYRGTQVEHLSLSACFHPDFDKRKLCNMFPNVRDLELRYFGGGKSRQNYINSKFHFMYPMSKLERLADIGECELTCQLVASNLCNRLQLLELDFLDSPESMSSIVIPQLKNMPVLELLDISYAVINVNVLEIIHSNLPSLKTLELKEIELTGSEFPRNINPAISIVTLNLTIETTPDLHTHIQFYEYMAQKYPSISNFFHHDETMVNEDPDYVKQLFKRGLLPFLKNIKPHVNNYYFENYCDGLGAFKKFDEFGWKLKYLSVKAFIDDSMILEELTQSEQSKYIEELAMEEFLPEPMNMLVNMKALTTLSIECEASYSDRDLGNHVILNLSKLLEACPPTLSTLSASSMELVFNESTSNITSIKHLKLSFIDLTPDLASVIETNFPQLSSLEIKGGMTNDVTISLPNHNLQNVKITTEHENRNKLNDFSIKTTCDGKLEYYAAKKSLNLEAVSCGFYSQTCIPVPREELIRPLMLNFTCASVKELSFSIDSKTLFYENIFDMI